MRFAFPVITTLNLLFLCTCLFGADFYQWTDKQGGVHFSDSISGIPEQYRGQALEGAFDQESSTQKKPEPKTNQDLVPSIDTTPQAPQTHQVPYTAFEGATSRVIIDVTFNHRVTVPMVLDTGAGEVIISEDLAKKLGIFEHEHAKLDVFVSGFGGTAPAIRTILDHMKIGDIENQFIPTRVVPPLSKAFYGVVGMNFMSNYTVRINPLEQVVIFEEVHRSAPHFGGHGERWWRRYFAEFNNYHGKLQQRVASIERFLRENRLAYKSVIDAVKEELQYAKAQYREAQKLLEKLTRYASQNQVPVSWRRLNH